MLTYPTPPKGGGLYIIWLSDTHYYGGRTTSFERRWHQHLNALREGRHGQENRFVKPGEIPEGFKRGRCGPQRTEWVHRVVDGKTKRKRVSKEELPAFLGDGWSEGQGKSRKMAWIHDGEGTKKRVFVTELPKFLEDGWRRGSGVSTQGKRVWMHREGEQRRVRPSEVEGLLATGWERGQARFEESLIWVNRGEEKKRIPEGDLEGHLAGGWERGFGAASEERREKMRQRWAEGAYAGR